MLQCVNGDQVGRISRGKPGDTHQSGNLTDCNVQCRTRHESRDGSQRDEVDNPPASNKPNEADDGACDDRQGRGYNVGWNAGI